MVATVIDGKKHSADILKQVATDAQAFAQKHGRNCTLDVVLVGKDPASEVYVANKRRTAHSVHLNSHSHLLPASTTEDQLLALVHQLNADDRVDGILVQLPLPQHIKTQSVIEAIDPSKDVDGFHPLNTGLLYQGRPHLVPCTPMGCLHLLNSVHPQLSGLHTLVIGRSNIVGRPLAALLLARNCTVSIAHSQTRAIEALAQSADVIFAAAGVPCLVQPSWVRPEATVIDVGIHRISDTSKDKGYRLIGDVDPQVAEVAGHLSPVPGGVGPMTIAFLLSNTLKAAQARLQAS